MQVVKAAAARPKTFHRVIHSLEKLTKFPESRLTELSKNHFQLHCAGKFTPCSSNNKMAFRYSVSAAAAAWKLATE